MESNGLFCLVPRTRFIVRYPISPPKHGHVNFLEALTFPYRPVFELTNKNNPNKGEVDRFIGGSF